MPTIIREEKTPLYDDTGTLVAYRIETDTVETPPATTPATTTHRRLHTATPTTPQRQLKTSAPVRQPAPRQTLHAATPTTPPRQPTPARRATPARQPQTPSPVVFLSPTLKRVVTAEYCLSCHQAHRACQCWPSARQNARQLAAEAVEAAAPRERENTFAAAVRRQQEQGLRPGTPQPTPPAHETTLQAVVRLQKERGLR